MMNFLKIIRWRKFCYGKFFPLSCSVKFTTCSDRFSVITLPALKDNYMYILTDKKLKFGIAVDPVEPNQVLKSLQEHNLSLKAVLTTHHHFDHAGGNKVIREEMKDVPIYGMDERIEMTNKVHPDEQLEIGCFVIKCLHTPCHTSGHACYYIESGGDYDPICFTGDTLFVAGCGRFFEGSAAQMFKSLSLLMGMPLHTKLYCGHEYTINNLQFALSVEPKNEAIIKKLKTAEEQLKNGEPTVPSTVGEELTFNPFLRVSAAPIKNLTQETDPQAVIAALRKLKDNF